MINPTTLYDTDPPSLGELLCATAEVISADARLRRYQVDKVKCQIKAAARKLNINVATCAANGCIAMLMDNLAEQEVKH